MFSSRITDGNIKIGTLAGGFNGNGYAQDLTPFKSLSPSQIEQAFEEATVHIIASVEETVVLSHNNARTSLLIAPIFLTYIFIFCHFCVFFHRMMPSEMESKSEAIKTEQVSETLSAY